jgi:hypothetical protein
MFLDSRRADKISGLIRTFKRGLGTGRISWINGLSERRKSKEDKKEK